MPLNIRRQSFAGLLERSQIEHLLHAGITPGHAGHYSASADFLMTIRILFRFLVHLPSAPFFCLLYFMGSSVALATGHNIPTSRYFLDFLRPSM